MTKLLERAIAEASQRPDAEQDAIAARILAELADEQAWDRAFARTSDDKWDRLAAWARSGIEAGESKSLDDLIGPRRD